MSSVPALLSLHGITKRFERRTIIDHVTFEVAAGTIVGILGPNGAGKSTLLRMLMGLEVPDWGTILFQGQDITHHAPWRRAALRMAFVPQDNFALIDLTVRENLLLPLSMLQRVSSHDRNVRVDDLIELWDLGPVQTRPAGTLTHGERLRVGLACRMIVEPHILILDEPFSAVSPSTCSEIQDRLREIVARGVTVLLSDHRRREILPFTDSNYIFVDGSIIAEGSSSDIVHNGNAVSRYLGTSIADFIRTSSPNLKARC